MRLNNFDWAIIRGVLQAVIYLLLSFLLGCLGLPIKPNMAFVVGFGIGAFIWHLVFAKIKGEKIFDGDIL